MTEEDGSAKAVILTTVIPALGACISLAMYASPVNAVIAASKTKTLGALNPVPLAVTVANTIIWCVYGLLKQDPYVSAPNAAGSVIAMFCTLTAFGLADDKQRERIRLLVCSEFGILALLGVLSSFSVHEAQTRADMWGLAGNVVTLLYYGAPLSSMAEVIRTRNSASILLPLTAMNLLNAALWTTYGIAVSDVYIYAPNGIGVVLSLAQLALAFLFPARTTKPSSSSTSLVDRSHEAAYSRLTRPEEDLLPVSHK